MIRYGEKKTINFRPQWQGDDYCKAFGHHYTKYFVEATASVPEHRISKCRDCGVVEPGQKFPASLSLAGDVFTVIEDASLPNGAVAMIGADGNGVMYTP